MVIYGVALLAFCMFAGMTIGNILGAALGINADIGGVGFAMLLLIILSNYLMNKGRLDPKSQDGIKFWSAMYIPIVIAMAARQDVVEALAGGSLAFFAGLVGTLISFAFVPILSKLSSKKSEEK